MNLSIRLPWLFGGPAIDDDEPEEEDESPALRLANEFTFQSGVRGMHAKPLLWSTLPGEPGNYYCARPGDPDYILVKVLPGDEYGLGLRWAGPLPKPYEAKARP